MDNNVAFIIGNGLDLSLGLNTSYRNFYDYVRKHKLHTENKIYMAIEKEAPELWADFELGLGRFTNQIEHVTEKERLKWSHTLNEELDEIKKDLKRYMKEQNALVDEPIPNIQFNHQSFYAGLEAGQVSNIESHFIRGAPIAMRFITLNYTDVLEKLFPVVGSRVPGENYFVMEDIHHVHGSIDRKISLGVNDESQISSYIDAKEKEFLIKPKLIRSMNDRRLEILSNYIDKSEIMVLFGVSLGATDKYIWDLVIQWLVGDKSRLLIIHHYEKGLDVGDLTDRQALQLSNRVMNKLLDYSMLDNETREVIKSKIYVIPNTSTLFAVSKD